MKSRSLIYWSLAALACTAASTDRARAIGFHGGGGFHGGFGGGIGGAGGFRPGGFGGLSGGLAGGLPGGFRPPGIGGFGGGLPPAGGFGLGAGGGARPNFGAISTPLSAFGGGMPSRPALLGGLPGEGAGQFRPGGAGGFSGGAGDFAGAANRFPGGNATAGQLNRFLDLPGGGLPGGMQGGALPALARPSPAGYAGNRPSWLNQATAANASVASRLGEAVRPGSEGAGRLSNWAQTHPDQLQSLSQRGDAVRQRFDQRAQGGNWWADHQGDARTPGSDWWSKDHPNLANWYYHNDWHHHNWQYWWDSATTSDVSNWFADEALLAPLYYDYGPQGNVQYVDNNVYVGGQDVGTADRYAQSASDLATIDPAASGAAAGERDWLPLGTFAVFTSPDQTDPTRLLQLAVDKQGIISGTLHNGSTDKAYVVQGKVDKKTQRVAMTIGANSDVVLETGLYNLTQPQTEALVHYGPQRTETYTLVRLNKPPAPVASTPPVSAPAPNATQ